MRKHLSFSPATRKSKLLNEEGIALAMVLVVSVILLAIMAGLIYMITSGTQVSGIKKRYKSALEAGHGGADVFLQLIHERGNLDTELTNDLTNFLITASNVGGVNCLTPKLNSKTSDWPSVCSDTLTIDPDVPSTYDMTFDLGTDPSYTIRAKIVDTVEGNSGAGLGLRDPAFPPVKGATPVHLSYYYTIEVDAQNSTNPAERAKLSILYQY